MFDMETENLILLKSSTTLYFAVREVALKISFMPNGLIWFDVSKI